MSSSSVPGVCELPVRKSRLPDEPVCEWTLVVPRGDSYTAAHPGARGTWKGGLGRPHRAAPERCRGAVMMQEQLCPFREAQWQCNLGCVHFSSLE